MELDRKERQTELASESGGGQGLAGAGRADQEKLAKSPVSVFVYAASMPLFDKDSLDPFVDGSVEGHIAETGLGKACGEEAGQFAARLHNGHGPGGGARLGA